MVKGFCQDTDFTIFQYPILRLRSVQVPSKEVKVRRMFSNENLDCASAALREINKGNSGYRFNIDSISKTSTTLSTSTQQGMESEKV